VGVLRADAITETRGGRAGFSTLNVMNRTFAHAVTISCATTVGFVLARSRTAPIRAAAGYRGSRGGMQETVIQRSQRLREIEVATRCSDAATSGAISNATAGAAAAFSTIQPAASPNPSVANATRSPKPVAWTR
jgi:hypothetical protein